MISQFTSLRTARICPWECGASASLSETRGKDSITVGLRGDKLLHAFATLTRTISRRSKLRGAINSTNLRVVRVSVCVCVCERAGGHGIWEVVHATIPVLPP